jgi:hypothetical protein
MFVSPQTYERLQMTVYAIIEVTQFLFNEGSVKYVSSEKFCQDDLENYFERQRAIGRRHDNPRVSDVGYSDNTIKSQFYVRPIAGKFALDKAPGI